MHEVAAILGYRDRRPRHLAEDSRSPTTSTERVITVARIARHFDGSRRGWMRRSTENEPKTSNMANVSLTLS